MYLTINEILMKDAFKSIHIYYIDTDEIPGFLLLLKTARSEDNIFIFHV